MVAVTTWTTPKDDSPMGGPVTIEVMESTPGVLVNGALPEGCNSVFVLIPGNPGIVHFYQKLVQEIIRKHPHCCVLVMGMAGHSLEELNSGRVFDLQHQFELAEAFMRFALSLVNPKAGQYAFVGGHSIGSLVAMAVTARFPSISKCFMLTPTICHMIDSPNGRRNKHALRAPIRAFLSGVVAPFLGSFPAFLQRTVLHLTHPEMDAGSKTVVMNMARGNLVRNVLHMASTEFQQLGSLDIAHLQDCQERLVFYFVRHDGWVPMSDYYLIKEHAPKAAAMILEEDCEVAHAWCLLHNHQVLEHAITPFMAPAP